MILLFEHYIPLSLIFIDCLRYFRMETAKSRVAEIQGKNFQAKLQLVNGTLCLEATEFVNGSFYAAQITNEFIEKHPRHFLIFKTTDEIFEELLANDNLVINDEQSIIIFTEIIYRGKKFKLLIQVPLNRRKFKGEEQTFKNLFEQIQKLNNEKKIQRLYVPQIIRLRKDCTNERQNIFQVSNEREIRMLGFNQEHIFHHYEVLPEKGVFYFKLRVKNSAANYIVLGICGRNIRLNTKTDIFKNPYFIGLSLCDGVLFNYGKYEKAVPDLKVEKGKTVFKVELDMNNQRITWFSDDVKMYSAQISKEILDVGCYPMFKMFNNNDIVELVEQ